ncbi:MAG: helix-turn-helix domain-containing protein [Polyangia bacterium]
MASTVLQRTAQRVRDARQRRSMSTLALAEQAGVPRRVVSRIESAAPVPLEPLEAVCRVLGLEPPTPQPSAEPSGSTVYEQFGQLVRDRRAAAHLSRRALARRVRLSEATIKLLETARYRPSRATCIRLLRVAELGLCWEDMAALKLGDPPSALEAVPAVAADAPSQSADEEADGAREVARTAGAQPQERPAAAPVRGPQPSLTPPGDTSCSVQGSASDWLAELRKLGTALSRAARHATERVLSLMVALSPRDGAAASDEVTIPIGTNLADAQRALVLRSLAACRGDRSKAAAMLGISRRALYYKLKAYAAGEH